MDLIEHQEKLKSLIFEVLSRLPENKWCLEQIQTAIFDSEYEMDIKCEAHTMFVLDNLMRAPSEISSVMLQTARACISGASMLILLKRKENPYK